MTGKTILIIGATAGIGRASAAQLAHQGAHVTITGRDPDKTARTAAEIRTRTGNIHVDHLTADLSALTEVRRLASEFTRRCPKLHVLINNLGCIWPRAAPRSMTWSTPLPRSREVAARLWQISADLAGLGRGAGQLN